VLSYHIMYSMLREEININHNITVINDVGWMYQLSEKLDTPLYVNQTITTAMSHSTYISALYFTCTSLTSVGFGNVAANTNLEKIFSIISMLIGGICSPLYPCLLEVYVHLLEVYVLHYIHAHWRYMFTHWRYMFSIISMLIGIILFPLYEFISILIESITLDFQLNLNKLLFTTCQIAYLLQNSQFQKF